MLQHLSRHQFLINPGDHVLTERNLGRVIGHLRRLDRADYSAADARPAHCPDQKRLERD